MQRPKQLRVGGYWLASIGAWGELTWSTQWPGGCWDASWKMDLPLGFRHPALERGQRVEILDGPLVIWSGTLTEPNRSDWSFAAEGLVREGDHYMALNGSGLTSSTSDTVVDAAIARGLPWKRLDSISTTPFADKENTDNLNTVTALLNAYADRQSRRVVVDAQGVLTLASDPTTPTWHLTPGAASLGMADDEYASDVFVRWKDQDNGDALTTTVASDVQARDRWGRREYPVDLTALGPIKAGRAAGVAEGILTKGKAKPSWTNGLEVSPYELTSTGGVPADLSTVQAGDMVRIHGLFDDSQSFEARPYLDLVLGQVQYTDGAETVALTPLNVAARTLEAITRQQFRRARKGMWAFGQVKN
jgi:hypothetical protein